MIKKILILFLFFCFLTPVNAQSETQLVLSPSLVKRQPGEIFSLEVRISTAEQILGTDLDLTFDPAYLEAQKIAPGDFFAEPKILTNQIENKNGLLKYSLFSYPTRQGSGSLAAITFKALKETDQPSSVSFAQTTAISSVGEKKIVFKTTPAAVEIARKGALPSPSVSPANLSPAPFQTPTPTPAPQKPNFLLSLAKILGIILLLGGVLILVFTLTIL